MKKVLLAPGASLMAERLLKSTVKHVQYARDVNERIQRGYNEWGRAGRIWVEPRSVSLAMRRMMQMHRRYAAGDWRHTESEMKAQEEVTEFLYRQHCELRGVPAKSRERVIMDFAAEMR